MATYIYRFACGKEEEVCHPMAWVSNEPQGFYEGRIEGFEQLACSCGNKCKAERIPVLTSYSKTYLESSSRNHWLTKANGLYQARKKREAKAKRRLKRYKT